MDSARLIRVRLDGELPPSGAALLVRDDARPFALTGVWAGGGAIAGSDPVRVGEPDEDPFGLLDVQPEVSDAADGAVGGGWFGYLGYGLGSLVERLPPVPPRPLPLPAFALAFYDHVLRLDASGQWWFEALWTDVRDAALRERLELLRARLAEGATARPVEVGEFAPTAPGAAGHLAAVEQCRERIAAGEIYQANLCLRLEASFQGAAPDLFAHLAGELEPRYGALVSGPWGAVCSASPELFLRRSGREVVSEPIKGTAPMSEGARDALLSSTKDRAENVMIVDLMRNDLGRVCEYGSVHVPELTEPKPGPGVWHLVSTVAGRLRPEVGDGALVRAAFPPGSVTGAPKIQAMRVIAELESSGREAYTGAIGFASPVAGLELNVAIRTLEVSGDRVWLGAGGGIVADSVPERELEEALLKARGVVPKVASVTAHRPATTPPRALAGGADRPDPALGVFTTILLRDGAPVDAAAHLSRLAASVGDLYGAPLPEDLEQQLGRAAQGLALGRLRVVVDALGSVSVEAAALTLPPEPSPLLLIPFALPGGLGAHKWQDRRLLVELERRGGGVPLIVDLDGHVLEAAHANVFIREGSTLITPPLDGRQLPGTARAHVLATAHVGEEPITLGRAAAADELLLTSSLRGLHPAMLERAKTLTPS